MATSIIDQGMELLRAQGLLEESTVELPDVETPQEEASELDVMKALVDQLQAMTDRLSLAEAVDVLQMQVRELTLLVTQLTTCVMMPTIKVPVRDQTGRITEVREIRTPNSVMASDLPDPGSW